MPGIIDLLALAIGGHPHSNGDSYDIGFLVCVHGCTYIYHVYWDGPTLSMFGLCIVLTGSVKIGMDV